MTMRARSFWSAAALGVAILLLPAVGSRPQAQEPQAVTSVLATERSVDDLRSLVATVRRMEDLGTLRVVDASDDPLVPGTTQERLQQFHLGLPVVGGTLVRQTSDGVVSSILGQVYRTDVTEATPDLSRDDVEARLTASGHTLLTMPTLRWLGLDDGGVALVYEVSVSTTAIDARRVYVDAASGEERLSIPLIRTQQAVGEGRGVHGERKKLATRQSGAVYLADDLLRPPVIATLDSRGVIGRLVQLLNGATVATADYATDTDNEWGDPVAVDAHVYMGWTYDYLYKRLGVRGFNNADAPIRGAINPYTAQQCVTSVPANEVGILCINAFWAGTGAGPAGQGLMVFGNGIPSNFTLTSTGQTVGPLAGALDVVAHELAHGVTDYTSGLEYRNESGALNESFSDMVGVAVEAFFEPIGAGLQKADYLLGEDAFRASRTGSVSGIRSIQSPVAYGHPDHWTVRYTGTQDNGGVHINSGIPNHVYYLAIEGGSNRISRLAVTGVGFSNRELVEKVFFRAFTRLLPVRATFLQARAATIQAARDLYPTNSVLLAAVTDAWTAVGVQ